MNFTINLEKIGELSMQNLVLIGIFIILCLIVWQMSNILNAIANLRKTNHEIKDNSCNTK